MLRTSEKSKNKQELFSLINKLPNKEVHSVKNYIEYLIAKNRKKESQSFLDYLNSVPEEEEELTGEAIKEIKRAKKGKTISLEELRDQM